MTRACGNPIFTPHMDDWERESVDIIESVDSICRDSADTQYMLIQTNFSKSPKQLTYKPLLHPTVHLRVFSWRKTYPVALKSIPKVPNQKVTRRPKCFSFFFFFFFFFRRASSNLRDSFTMVLAQNSSIFHWAVHQPIAFFQVWSHTRRFEPLTEELWLPLRCHFFFMCTHAHKSLLSRRGRLWTLNFELSNEM